MGECFNLNLSMVLLINDYVLKTVVNKPVLDKVIAFTIFICFVFILISDNYICVGD